jgi:hypothetical protein
MTGATSLDRTTRRIAGACSLFAGALAVFWLIRILRGRAFLFMSVGVQVLPNPPSPRPGLRPLRAAAERQYRQPHAREVPMSGDAEKIVSSELSTGEELVWSPPYGDPLCKRPDR